MMDSAGRPSEERSAITQPASDKGSLEIGAPDINSVKSYEPLDTGHDFAPKMRKPYTITKQRERWTDDEHKKFLEALKLYGRAWRKIEEHVGTKTAVQIRSHAQKFFSKVVRESNAAGEASSVKPIEIPPPRPKRKPMHPYPRKVVSPGKTGKTVSEKQTNPASPKYSEQDNQSPTSVLSTICSDSSVGPDSCMLTGSPSSEAPKLVSESAILSQPDQLDENLSCDDRIPLDLELSTQNGVFVKEDPNESAAQSLKLFGKTLVLVDPQECKTDNLFDTNEESCIFPFVPVYTKHPSSTSEYIQNDSFRTDSNTCFPVPLPWLTLCNNTSCSSIEVHSPTPIKARPPCVSNEPKEGSSADSNATISSRKLTSTKSLNRNKGFVPYKRCLSEQEKCADEREQQQIRLCL